MKFAGIMMLALLSFAACGGGLSTPGQRGAALCSASLKMIRAAIYADPERWKKVSRAKQFTKTFALAGESLKRPPKGYDADHPLVDDLKRKDFIVIRYFAEGDALAPDFMGRFAEFCRTAAPLTAFLTEALDLKW